MRTAGHTHDGDEARERSHNGNSTRSTAQHSLSAMALEGFGEAFRHERRPVILKLVFLFAGGCMFTMCCLLLRAQLHAASNGMANVETMNLYPALKASLEGSGANIELIGAGHAQPVVDLAPHKFTDQQDTYATARNEDGTSTDAPTAETIADAMSVGTIKTLRVSRAQLQKTPALSSGLESSGSGDDANNVQDDTSDRLLDVLSPYAKDFMKDESQAGSDSSDLPADFDWQTYLHLNPDVAAVWDTKEGAEAHYKLYGRAEVRQYTQLASSVDGAESLLPADFDWQLYISYYPDLQSGVRSRQKAEQHYLQQGRFEHRVYKRPPLLLRYSTCGALTNQHYAHIAGLAIGIALKASIVMPPALQRNTYRPSSQKGQSGAQAKWVEGPASSLWDVDALISYWAGQGTAITLASFGRPRSNAVQPQHAFPNWLPQGYGPEQVVRMPHVYLANLHMQELVASAMQLVVGHATAARDVDKPILLDLPCTLFALNTSSAPELVEQVARSLKFAKPVQAIANKVVSSMQLQVVGGKLNGLHLRMERDSNDWVATLGGADKLFDMYLAACRAAGFSGRADMYLVTGMRKADEVAQRMPDLRGLAARIHHKAMYIPKEKLALLSSEQSALVDLLVLAEAENFVGISISTFSYLLQEHRALSGRSRSTTRLVDASVAGTDGLFAAAAALLHPVADTTRR